ncbi:MAG: hypothetical protein KDK34_01305 [Leptospiraceae bacterium]|nr:hypothetical protein [Leptospiraceae bacterium]
MLPLIPLLVFESYCGPPAVQDAYLCDQFTDGACVQPVEEQWNYHPDVPAFRRTSWKTLGYHMYFHTRETPGMRVDFNHSASDEELADIRATAGCRFRMQDAEGNVIENHMEGVRVDADGVWCFEYLGDMLIEFHEQRGTLEDAPDPAWFPIMLRISFHASRPPLSVAREAPVLAEW